VGRGGAATATAEGQQGAVRRLLFRARRRAGGQQPTYAQGLLDLSYFVVPKGANPAEKAAAMGLLHEMSVARNQATAAEVIPYTGASPALEQLLPQARLDEFPTTRSNKDVQVAGNPAWWAQNRDAAERRWQEFKLGL
jgi:putative spermidine/putrescine transport system substrate-binding protein